MASLPETGAALAADIEESRQLAGRIAAARTASVEIADGLSATGSEGTAATVRSCTAALDKAVSSSSRLPAALDQARGRLAEAE